MKPVVFTPAIKAGKLANGAERGKGAVVHACHGPEPYLEKALCGEAPKIQWSVRRGAAVTCAKCLKRLMTQE